MNLKGLLAQSECQTFLGCLLPVNEYYIYEILVIFFMLNAKDDVSWDLLHGIS